MKDFKKIQCNNCKSEVVLVNLPTITCSCGTDYNCFGQELASREQWGYETGESLSDILNGNDDW